MVALKKQSESQTMPNRHGKKKQMTEPAGLQSIT